MRHSNALLLALTLILALFSGWTAALVRATPVEDPSLTSAKPTSIRVEIHDRLSDEPVVGQRYDLIANDETRYLTTTPSGLDLGSLDPGFYYLEEVSYRKLDDGTDVRVVEARDILRVQKNGGIFLNGQPMPSRLYSVKSGKQNGSSGLIFRLWDKQTGIGIPEYSLQLQRLGRAYSAEELQYIEDMEAYIAALESEPAEDDEAKLAEARATLQDFLRAHDEPEVIGNFKTDSQGILYLAPLELGNYRLVSSALGNIDFSVTEEAPVAYPTASLVQPTLPQWTSASLTLEGGPELQGESWMVMGQLLQDGQLLRAAAWSSAQSTVSFEDLPAYGPDRMAYHYNWKLNLPAGYELDDTQDPWILHRVAETSMEPTTEAPTTESTAEETTQSTSDPVPGPTSEPSSELTTEPTPSTEPSQSKFTLPGHPELTLPTLPDLTLPTADPSQPKATLPERPHANGGQIPRPQSPQRPGNLADGGGLQMGDETTSNPVDAFKDDEDAPQTFDPGVKGSIAIAIFAVLAILVLELLQRHRDD